MNDRAEATRKRLVEAATDALAELDVAALVTAIGTREIARRAGVSPATLFHHFGTVEEFGRAVAAHVYEPEALPTGTINAKVADMAEASDPVTASFAMHRSEFTRLQNDPRYRLRIGLWAFGGDESRELYGEFFRVTDARIVPVVSEIFARWGREIRPPFDMAALVAAQSVLVSGSLMRHDVDGDRWDAVSFASAASAMGLAFLREQGDDRDFGDRVTELARMSPRRPATRSGARTRQRALDAAAECFRRHGYGATTMSEIAAAAHVSVSTLYDLFEGKAAVAVAVVVADAERELRLEAVDAVTVLEAVAAFLQERADHLDPYLTQVLVGAPGRASDGVVGVLARAIEAEQAAGVLRADVAAAEVARIVVLIMGSQVLGRPGQGVGETLSMIAPLVHEALLAPRPD